MTTSLDARLRLAAVGSAAAFAVLAVLVATGAVDGVDRSGHDAVVAHRPGWLTPVATACTYLGWTPLAYVAVLAAALARRSVRAGGAALATLLIGQLARFALSQAIDRSRPPRADWIHTATGASFPSGHSTTAVLAWGLVALLLGGGAARCWAVLAGVLVGLSRVYLGVHWPSDVLGGWLFGSAVVLAVAGVLPKRQVSAADGR